MNNEGHHINEVLETLRNPQTIRAQSNRLLERVKQNRSAHFIYDPEKMTSTASFIIDVIISQYPDLNVPYHSRWRHFEAGSIDRINALKRKADITTAEDWGKILYELVIISVFLDAGAGPLWRYREPSTGQEYSRSEGLALASLELYCNGAFSADPKQPLRVDAQRLIDFTEHNLMDTFQVSQGNPLEGVTGRVSLLNRLGASIKKKPQYFGEEARLGNFYSYVSSLKTNDTLQATQIFQAILDGFNDMWPVRLSFHGVSLGDVWKHQGLKTNQPDSDYIPFHKLSQWLAYSLIEPLEQAGIKVTDLDQLTGLPEYRNGGLLIDSGLLQVKNEAVLLEPQEPGSELIIEWRALTVALLDELTELIRHQLRKDATELPLAKILQGGTWEAGRRIAKQKRSQGTPPIQIISDGTVF